MKSIRMSSTEMNKSGEKVGKYQRMGRSEFPIEWSEKASLRRLLKTKSPRGVGGSYQDVSGRKHVRRREEAQNPHRKSVPIVFKEWREVWWGRKQREPRRKEQKGSHRGNKRQAVGEDIG